MDRENCSRGHRFREGDNFCGICGEDRQGPRSRCPKCGHEDVPDMRFCTQCRAPLVAVGVANASASITSSIFGRNHDVFVSAVTGHEGEVLSIRDLKGLVNSVDPDFNSGSFLPNDHGDGNEGACGCSKVKGGVGARPIFDRVERGLYKVIDYSGAPDRIEIEALSAGAVVTATSGIPNTSATVSDWLLGQSASRINVELGYENPARVLVGQKGGRWIAVGKKLPYHELTRGYQTSWALGIDTRMDFQLGGAPAVEPTYLGMRCDRNVGGFDGATIYNALEKFLPGSWKTPDKYWPIWTEPNALDEDGHALSAGDYIDAVISTYVETYKMISTYLESK